MILTSFNSYMEDQRKGDKSLTGGARGVDGKPRMVRSLLYLSSDGKFSVKPNVQLYAARNWVHLGKISLILRLTWL